MIPQLTIDRSHKKSPVIMILYEIIPKSSTILESCLLIPGAHVKFCCTRGYEGLPQQQFTAILENIQDKCISNIDNNE